MLFEPVPAGSKAFRKLIYTIQFDDEFAVKKLIECDKALLQLKDVVNR